MKGNEKHYWLDDPSNVTKLFRGLWVVGIVLLLCDLLLHKHEDFTIAGWFSFYGIFGFVACVVLVITAKGLRRLLMRSEDYYDER